MTDNSFLFLKQIDGLLYRIFEQLQAISLYHYA